jgi:hypothetical protein
MIIQELPLLLGKGPQVHVLPGWYPHPPKGLLASHGGYDQSALILERAEPLVEQVINGRRQQKSVFAEKTLRVRTVAPWADVTCDQVLWSVHSSHAAGPFNLPNVGAEDALPTTSLS